MGLDMTLYRKARDLPENFEYEYGDEDREYEEFSATHEDVAYWRKVNHVHGWFVNTLADGVDECQEIPVPREALIELRDLAQKVLDGITFETVQRPHLDWVTQQPTGQFYEDVEVIAYDEETTNLLPPVGGFFFGTYEIDGWYVQGTQETVTMLTEVLEKYPNDEQFVYLASW